MVRSASLIASRKEIRIQYESPGEEIPITGDYGRLKQMFMVVIDNAVKYSDAGSEILISTGKQNDRYAVSIKDEGKGIPENMQQLVFQNFYSTSENGLGLGLAIMENIAKRHDIEVSLESRKDSGTVVTFLLPTSEAL